MVETIYPRIRLVDESPSKRSQLHLGEVQRCDHVGVLLEPAFGASEKRLGSPICFVDVSASCTSSGGVSRVHINDWYPPLKRFVFNKELKFMVRPAVEVSVLAFPMFRPAPYSSKLLHYDYVAFFKGVHELSADLMENTIGPPAFFSAQLFQR